ncbi:ROK family protein, partial [Candidatus Bathyarchaeota archaeon]|nr:ROK family protein [Candidatus Bathyarchaeota archaeon]
MKENIRDAVTLGVDLGGTKVEIALVDLDGQILAVRKYPTNPGKGPEGVINDVLACIRGCLGEVKLETRALGIGIAGQVSVDGVVRFAPNLRWRNVPLRKRLE